MIAVIKKRFESIFRLLEQDLYSTEVGGEDLKYDYQGFRSFELTHKDRFVVEILKRLCRNSSLL